MRHEHRHQQLSVICSICVKLVDFCCYGHRNMVVMVYQDRHVDFFNRIHF